jgi:hypothetical protein
MLVNAGNLNALASNLTNLYTYNQAGFRSQRPAVIAKQTTGQAIADSTDTLVTFQVADVNTDNMFTASVADHLTTQHAGIYLVFSQLRYNLSAGTVVSGSILVNGTAPATNGVATQNVPLFGTPAGATGPTPASATIVNLAAGATIYLNAFQVSGGSKTLSTTFGGTYLGAIFLTPST